MAPPRIAIAGTGWAGRVHALSSAALVGGQVAQVLSRTADGAAALGVDLGVDHGTYAELSPRCGIVVVASPAEHHAEMTIDALGRGMAVLVEKPLATTLAEADAMVSAAASAGVLTGYAENLLVSPAVDAALAHRPRMGPLTHLSLRFESEAPTWGHFLEPLPGGGVLHDLGAHPVALALAFAGSDPVAVSAELSSTRADGADDRAGVGIRFADGLRAEVEVSWTATEPIWDLQAAGGNGVARVEFLPELLVELDGDDATPSPTLSDLVDPHLETFGYVAQLQGFVDALGGRGGRVCPLGFGRLVLEVTCAAYLSAGTGGAEVSLPYTGPRGLTPLQLWRG